MDGLKAINELNDLQAELDKTIKQMATYGKQYAEADSRYRVSVRQSILRLRDEGYPVTIIRDLVLGEVADIRQEMNIAEAFYKTAQEKVQALKLQLRLLDNQIQREYGNQ